MGQLDRALPVIAKALEIDPNYLTGHNNLTFCMCYHPAYDSAAIADELCRWNQRHAEPLKHLIQPHDNDRDPERRLRASVTSRQISTSIPLGRLLLLPLLANRDKSRFEIFAYAQVPRSDAVTERLRGHADAWRNMMKVSDSQAAQCIRDDRIDILARRSSHCTPAAIVCWFCAPPARPPYK